MKKPAFLILSATICIICVSCTKNPGKITSSSRFVTPMMIQQIQKTVDNMPNPEDDSAAAEILKADILSAFKRDDKKEENTQKQNKQNELQSISRTGQNDASNQEISGIQKQEAEPEKEEKPKKESNKTQIDAVAEDETVYVSNSGKKFHKNPDCSNMTAPVGMTRKEAENSGRTYCKKCYE